MSLTIAQSTNLAFNVVPDGSRFNMRDASKRPEVGSPELTMSSREKLVELFERVPHRRDATPEDWYYRSLSEQKRNDLVVQLDELDLLYDRLAEIADIADKEPIYGTERWNARVADLWHSIPYINDTEDLDYIRNSIKEISDEIKVAVALKKRIGLEIKGSSCTDLLGQCYN